MTRQRDHNESVVGPVASKSTLIQRPQLLNSVQSLRLLFQLYPKSSLRRLMRALDHIPISRFSGLGPDTMDQPTLSNLRSQGAANTAPSSANE
jgi:hypothetical protein